MSRVRRIGVLFFLLLLPVVSQARVAGDASLPVLTQAQAEQLQTQIRSVLGGDYRLGARGTRPLAELSTPIDGIVVLPLTIPPRVMGNTTDAPLCFNVLLMPNRLANWALTLQTEQGFWNLEVGPVYTFNVTVGPGTYFYWIFGWTGCTNQLSLTYRWDQPGSFWQYWHFVVANFGPAGYNYPLIGPGFTIAGPNKITSSGSLAVHNAGDAFCDAPFNSSGNCTGNSIPTGSVTINYAGRLNNDPPPNAVPALAWWGSAALATLLLAFGALVALRRYRKSAA